MRLLAVLLAGLSLAYGQLTSSELSQFAGISYNEDSSSFTFFSDGLTDTADPDNIFPGRANPNDISEQDYVWTVPKSITYLDEPTCLPMGAIGVAVDGIPFFNPYTAEDTDAVVNEQFDTCQGHPDMKGQYHYHQNSDCLHNEECALASEQNKLIGVAFDGIPIYGMCDGEGNKLTSADLDDCHGHELNGRYVYRATADFPYLLGCYKGQAESRRALTEGDHCKYAIAENAGDNLISENIDEDEDSEEAPLPPSGGNQGNGNQPPSSGRPSGGRPRPSGGRPRPSGGRMPRPRSFDDEHRNTMGLLKRLLTDWVRDN